MAQAPETPEPLEAWSLLKSTDPTALHTHDWLRWHPSELEACVEARTRQLPEPLTVEELAELRAAHERWGADAASLAALELLGRPETRVIVTGQQPGLMAGPLLVLHKTMAAIELARRLRQSHPALNWVPVFWVASEDHDFDEIRRVYWPGHSGQLEEFLLQHSSWKAGQMVGRIKTAPILAQLRTQIESTTFKTEFRPAVLDLLEEVYCGEGDIESGFCRLLLRLLAGTGLVIVSPLMPWVRRRAVPILEQEFARPCASSGKIIARAEAIRAAGFEPHLHRPADAINAFWVDSEERRYTLRRQNGEVQRALPQNGQEETIDQPPLATAELVAMLRQDPLQFSGNVVTRPLVQDAILPTVAQVVGPGEAAYLAQVEAVYADFGVFAPVRYPRPQLTLVEPRVDRNLEKYHVDLHTAYELGSAELIETVLRRDLQEAELKDLDQTQQRQLDELKALKDKYANHDPAMESAFDKLEQAMAKGYEKIVERLLYQRQQDERSLGQAMALISNSLRPNGQSQGRSLNPLVPFAVQYGLDWAMRLMPMIDFDFTRPMQVIHLTKLAQSGTATTTPVSAGDES